MGHFKDNFNETTCENYLREEHEHWKVNTDSKILVSATSVLFSAVILFGLLILVKYVIVRT